MLNRRLLGVLKQYGPEVAFFTTEVCIGRVDFVSPPEEAWRGDGLSVFQCEIEAEIAESDERPFATALAAYVREHLERGTWHACWITSGELYEDRHDVVLDPTKLLQSTAVLGLVPWIARVVNRWLKEGARFEEVRRRWRCAPPGRPDMKALRVLALYYGPMRWLANHVIEVADWARARRPNLMPLSVLQVRARVQQWQRARERQAALTGPRPESPVVFTHGDYRIERLLTKEALVFEGRAQRHCVGDGSYWSDVASEKTRIYAVVDANGKSHATVEVMVLTSLEVTMKVGAGMMSMPCYGTDAAKRILGTDAPEPLAPPRLQMRQVKGHANRAVTKKPVLTALAAFYEREKIEWSASVIASRDLIDGLLFSGLVTAMGGYLLGMHHARQARLRAEALAAATPTAAP